MKAKVTLEMEVEFDPEVTDAESLAAALDSLMDTVLSTPGILKEYGNPEIGVFWVKRGE